MTEPTPAKMAADKARAVYRKTAEEFDQFTKDAQMPEAVRVFAEKNIAQSREIYERSKDALTRAYAVVAKNLNLTSLCLYSGLAPASLSVASHWRSRRGGRPPGRCATRCRGRTGR